MLADKTLLSVTLAATFASGACVGFAAGGGARSAGPPSDAAAVYAPQLDELAAKGYDAAEMGEARQAYGDYLKGYETWWNAFLDVHHENVDKIEDKLAKRLSALDARHRERAGAK